MLHPCVVLDMLSVGENQGHFWFDNYTLGGLIHAAGICATSMCGAGYAQCW